MNIVKVCIFNALFLLTGISYANNAHSQVGALGDMMSVADGEVKYLVCDACHGKQGQGMIGPSLQNRDAEYITERLIAYRNRQRVGAQSDIMWTQAARLSDEDIKNLANFIAEEFGDASTR